MQVIHISWLIERGSTHLQICKTVKHTLWIRTYNVCTAHMCFSDDARSDLPTGLQGRMHLNLIYVFRWVPASSAVKRVHAPGSGHRKWFRDCAGQYRHHHSTPRGHKLKTNKWLQASIGPVAGRRCEDECWFCLLSHYSTLTAGHSDGQNTTRQYICRVICLNL